LLAAIPAAQAQPGVVTKVNPDARANEAPASGYWTPERFKAAKPVPMPVVKPGPNIETNEAPDTKPCGQSASSDAQAPSEEPVPAVEQSYDADPAKEKLERDAIPQPRDK
jgi:hypothetical protein